MHLPEKPAGFDDIRAELERLASGDAPWESGRVFGHAFYSDVGREPGEWAYSRFCWQNALDLDLFPSVGVLAGRLVDLAIERTSGPGGACGIFTQGGTESIFLACKAARDAHREAHGDTGGKLQIVAPSSAHPAFRKAAAYLDMEYVTVDIDPVTVRADHRAMRRAVTSRTALMVASAPAYFSGMVDDVAPLAETAEERGVPLHVDACMGGWLLPWFREAGAAGPDFDFSVPGVTSLSLDFHKYALCPKGASVVMFRERFMRRHALFVSSGWPGYFLANSAVLSTRSGSGAAAAYATVMSLGAEGYRRHASVLWEATKRLVSGLRDIDGIAVLGNPEFCILSFTWESGPLFHLGSFLHDRGWFLYPQFRYGDIPESLHLTVVPASAERVGEFLESVREGVEELSGAHFEKPAIDLESLDLENTPPGQLLSMLEEWNVLPRSGDDLDPGLKSMLNELPAAVRDDLILAYLNQVW